MASYIRFFRVIVLRLQPTYYKPKVKKTVFVPASGNRSGVSLNNRGSNGNYWSSTLATAANARNLNFNASGVNPTNTNNRFNGFSVRAVQPLLAGSTIGLIILKIN